MMRSAVILMMVFVVGSTAFGQSKYEKEFRIDEAQVPSNALNFIELLPFDRKIKWYKEIGLNQTSIEAKTKFQKKRHSIEFSKDGVFEDLEITVKWKSVPTNVQQKITTYLKAQFSKHKIEKIQIQYTGNQSTIKQILTDKTPQIDPIIHYELVVNTKSNKSYQKMEFLFSDQGEYVQSAVIISKNTDHLEY